MYILLAYAAGVCVLVAGLKQLNLRRRVKRVDSMADEAYPALLATYVMAEFAQGRADSTGTAKFWLIAASILLLCAVASAAIQFLPHLLYSFELISGATP